MRADYEQRHNLRLGREGFALPDLLIKSTGQRALIEWRPTEIADARVGFPAAAVMFSILQSFGTHLRS